MENNKTDREWRIEEKKLLITRCHELRLEYGLKTLDDLNLIISALKTYRNMRERVARSKQEKKGSYGRYG